MNVGLIRTFELDFHPSILVAELLSVPVRSLISSWRHQNGEHMVSNLLKYRVAGVHLVVFPHVESIDVLECFLVRSVLDLVRVADDFRLFWCLHAFDRVGVVRQVERGQHFVLDRFVVPEDIIVAPNCVRCVHVTIGPRRPGGLGGFLLVSRICYRPLACFEPRNADPRGGRERCESRIPRRLCPLRYVRLQRETPRGLRSFLPIATPSQGTKPLTREGVGLSLGMQFPGTREMRSSSLDVCSMLSK